MQELSYRLRTTAHDSYFFVEGLTVLVCGKEFGADDVTSEGKLMLSEIDRLVKRIEKQKQSLYFNEFLLKARSHAEVFAILHRACWETGVWPPHFDSPAPDPMTFVGLPMSSEIFDGEELYAVLGEGMLHLVFKNGPGSSPDGAVVDADDYHRLWRRIQEDLSRKFLNRGAR
jgi:hypothetical protein